jgi:hypothetical protein
MANGCTAEMDTCLHGMAEVTMRLFRIMRNCLRASMATLSGMMTRDQPQLQGGGNSLPLSNNQQRYHTGRTHGRGFSFVSDWPLPHQPKVNLTPAVYMSAVHPLHVHQLNPSRRSGDS